MTVYSPWSAPLLTPPAPAEPAPELTRTETLLLLDNAKRPAPSN